MIGGGLIGHALASGDRVLGNGLIASALCTKIPDDEPKVAPWIGRYCFDFTACFSQIQVTEIIISNKKHKAGLYNAQGKRIATWQESHINVNKHYTSSTCLTDEEAGTFNIVSRFPTTTKIVIPQFDYNLSSYVEIYDGAFLNQQNMERLCLPDGLHYIDSSAFSGCMKLRDITYYSLNEGKFIDEWAYFPPSLRNINTSSFTNCNSLENIVIPGPNLNSIGSAAFVNCYKLKTLQLPDENNAYYFYIYSQAFMNCYELRELHLSSKVSYVYSQCWMNCYKLEILTFEEGMSSIYQQAFYNCYKLQELVIPKSITYIDSAAFYNCNELHTLILPLRDCTESQTMSIYSSVFYGCYKLNNLYLPERTYFSGGTFNGIGRDLPQVNVYMASDAYISSSGMFGNNMGQNIKFYSAAASLQDAPNTYQSAFSDFYNSDNAEFIWGWADPHPIVKCGTLYFYFYLCYYNFDTHQFDETMTTTGSVKFLLENEEGERIYITPKNSWVKSYSKSGLKYGRYKYKILAATCNDADESKLGVWNEVELNASTVNVKVYFKQDYILFSEKFQLRAEECNLGQPWFRSKYPIEYDANGNHIVENGSANPVLSPGAVYRLWSIIYMDNMSVIEISHKLSNVPTGVSITFVPPMQHGSGMSISIMWRIMAGSSRNRMNVESTAREISSGYLRDHSTWTKSESTQHSLYGGGFVAAASVSIQNVIDESYTDYTPSDSSGGASGQKGVSITHDEITITKDETLTMPNFYVLTQSESSYSYRSDSTTWDPYDKRYKQGYDDLTGSSIRILSTSVQSKLVGTGDNLQALLNNYNADTGEFSVPDSYCVAVRSGYSVATGFWDSYPIAGTYIQEYVYGVNQGTETLVARQQQYLWNVLGANFDEFITKWRGGSTGQAKYNGKVVSGAYYDYSQEKIIVPKYFRSTHYANDWESYYN